LTLEHVARIESTCETGTQDLETADSSDPTADEGQGAVSPVKEEK